MMTYTSDQRRLISGWLMAWVQAAEIEMKRARPDAGGTFSAGQIDGMLFALALAEIDTAASALLTEEHHAVMQFRKAVPGFRDIRDMLTHFDDYVAGRGRLQKKQVVPEHFPVLFSRDPETVTLHIGGMEMRIADAFEAAVALHRAALDEIHRLDDEVSREYQEGKNV